MWAKPPELGDYSGRLRRLIARRFRTVEFGRVSVRNSSFEIFPRNLRSVFRNSPSWVLRELLFTFPRVIPSNVISALGCLRKVENGRFSVLRAQIKDEGSFFVFRRNLPTAFFRPIFARFFEAEDRRRRGFLRSSAPKMEYCLLKRVL